MTTNDRVVSWIADRARRRFSQDIELVLLYGSYVNGTANPLSDVDCYFIPKTERGYNFAVDFILEGVGYDIFPMSWERVEGIAALQEPLLPCVGDVRILYAGSEAALRRFQGIQRRMRENLKSPACSLGAAQARFDAACGAFSRLRRNAGDYAALRLWAGAVLLALADALAYYNQEYFHFGLKRQYEDIRRLPQKPDGFAGGYLGVIQAESAEETIVRCRELIAAVGSYAGWTVREHDTPDRPAPASNRSWDYAGMASLYEEIRSSFNKIRVCAQTGDAVLAFLSAVCLQDTLLEEAGLGDTPDSDLMSAYRFADLAPLEAAAKRAERTLVERITAAGGRIKDFACFEAFLQAAL